MHKIAAFLTFNNKVEKRILHFKKKVKSKFGKQIYLNHPVHLTLFTLNVKKLDELKKLYYGVNLKKKNKSIKVSILSAGVFFNDPITGGHTLYFSLKKTKQLMKIQNQNLKFINKNIDIIKTNPNIYKNRVLKKNYLKYGFAFSGRIWIPHITISSIKKIKSNHKFIKDFLKNKIKMSDTVNHIEFYNVKKDKHLFLFKTNSI